MKTKNYDFKGEKNNNSKLSDTQISQIKKEWETNNWTLRSLAARYGVTHGHIHKIVNGKTRQS